MKTIKNFEKFRQFSQRVGELINIEKRLPEQVFKSKFKHFVLMDCDEILWGNTIKNLKNFSETLNDEFYIVSVMYPDPKDYYYSHFNVYPVITVNSEIDQETYLLQINLPLSEGNEVLFDEAQVVLFYSMQVDWAIYCDTGFELAIAGFTNNEHLCLYKDSHKNIQLFNSEEAIPNLLEPVFINVGLNKSITRKLIENYK